MLAGTCCFQGTTFALLGTGNWEAKPFQHLGAEKCPKSGESKTFCHRKHCPSRVPSDAAEPVTWERFFWGFGSNTHDNSLSNIVILCCQIISLSVSLHNPWPLSIHTAYILIGTQIPTLSYLSSSLGEWTWAEKMLYQPKEITLQNRI